MSDAGAQHPSRASPAEATDLGCPRCGHAIGASCVLARERGDARVVCPECGFDCAIAQLDAGDHGPIWFVESPLSPRTRVRRAIETFLVAQMPHLFWSRVPMSLRARPGRIALFLLAVAAALHVVFAAGRIAESFPTFKNGMPPEAVIAEIVHEAAFPASPYSGADLLGIAVQNDPDRSVGVGTIARFIGLSLEGMTFKPWLESTVGLTVGTADGTIDSYYGTAGLHLKGPPFVAADLLLSAPKMKERGTPVFIEGVEMAYAFPIERETRTRMRVPLAIAAAGAYIAIFSIGLLALLPITLRRAKVRISHLLRAAAYAPAIVPLLTAAFLVAERLDVAGMLPSDDVPFVLAMTIGLPLVWLHAVCRCYLRIPHAALTAFLLTLLTLLVNLIVVSMLALILRSS